VGQVTSYNGRVMSSTHPVLDFISVTNLIRNGAFSEISLRYASTVQVEKAVLCYVKYRKNEMFWNGILNTEVLAEGLRCWKLNFFGLLHILDW